MSKETLQHTMRSKVRVFEDGGIRLLTAFAGTFTEKDGQNVKRNIAAHHEKQGSGL